MSSIEQANSAFTYPLKNRMSKNASGVVDSQQLRRLFLLHFTNDLWYNINQIGNTIHFAKGGTLMVLEPRTRIP
jgi:hypothetical protein